MFTGIVESKGVLQSITRVGKGAHVRVRTSPDFIQGRVRLGDSIANNGVCLTATQLYDDGFEADLSFESFYRVFKLFLRLNRSCHRTKDRINLHKLSNRFLYAVKE